MGLPFVEIRNAPNIRGLGRGAGGTPLDGRDYTILAVLSGDDPPTQPELAHPAGKAPGVIVSVIDGLEDAGLARRARDPRDRRPSRVTLTAEARRRRTAT